MRIKGAALLALIACMGTALAMAISNQDDASANIGTVQSKTSIANQSSTAQQYLSQSDFHFDLAAIKRPMPDNIQNSGLFQSHSWYVPPPPPPASLTPSAPSVNLEPLPPPPPPSAPQLPFIFIGRMIDGNEMTLFLSNNNRQYAVKINDVLDDTYRLDKLTEKIAVLTYLPLNIQQELVFNSTAIGISTLNAFVLVTPTQPTAQSSPQLELPQ